MNVRSFSVSLALASLILLAGCATTPPAPPSEASYAGPVYTSENVDVQPAPTYQVRPTYPLSLIQANASGWAVVSFVVTPQGRIADFQVTQSSDPAFAAAAKNAVLRWTYTPAQKNGQAVACRLTVPFNFPHPR